MIVTYRSDLIPALADLYAEFAAGIPGAIPVAGEHWGTTFARLGERSLEDIIISAHPTLDGPPSPAAFCWFPSRLDCGRTFMRGPYLSPGDPNLEAVLAESISEAVIRASRFGSELLEARSLHPGWSRAYKQAGFTNPGSYERWRLFPLRGAIELADVPVDGEIRQWSSSNDLDSLMPLFEEGFANDWDYVRPDRANWLEVINDDSFDPRLLLLAFESGKPAGYAFGRTIPNAPREALQTAYLISIDVVLGARKKGWGKALLSRWLRACYGAGVRAIELDVEANNAVAKHLYARFGFKHQTTEEVWWYRFQR